MLIHVFSALAFGIVLGTVCVLILLMLTSAKDEIARALLVARPAAPSVKAATRQRSSTSLTRARPVGTETTSIVRAAA